MTEDFTTWTPLLVSMGVFLLLVMLASGIVAFAPKSVFEPFRRLADFAARRPLAAVIAAALLVLGPVRDAVTKGTNEPPRGASVELRVESVKWKVENGGVVAAGDSTILHSTLSTLHLFSPFLCPYPFPWSDSCCLFAVTP